MANRWDTTGGASRLNEFREEVLQRFRAGDSLASIGQTYVVYPTTVQNWLKKEGEYDRVVECLLPECGVTYPFRPRKLYCTNLHARRANARAVYGRCPEKQRARSALVQAIYSGRIDRPKTCERCGCVPGPGKDGRSLIKADHHHGYDEAHQLDVWWICSGCDHEVEKLRRDGKTVDREHQHRDDIH